MNRIEDAERAVLCSLFRAWPEALVWIGGSVLHLLYASPRASHDLDLARRRGDLPRAADAAGVVRAALDQVNLVLGTRLSAEVPSGPGKSIRVADDGVPSFTVDFSAISGHIGEVTTTVLASVVGPQAVMVPTDSALLRLKLEALLLRRFLKAADVFDAWFLISRGVRLTPQQRRWLWDVISPREIDWQKVERRLAQLTAERFLADLKRRLPAESLHGWNTASAKAALDAVQALLRKVRR